MSVLLPNSLLDDRRSGEAAAYGRFLASASLGIAERPLIEVLPPEIELQSLWFSGSFGRNFRSARGELVEIVQFGNWNRTSGPDFRDAVVSIDGVLRKGSIELDTDVRDWERHQHGSNPEYDDVVLHLYFEAPATTSFFTRTSAHREVVQVRLDPAQIVEGSFRFRYQADAHIGRCNTALSEMDGEKVLSLLRSACRFRLERKTIRIRRLIEAHGPEQAVYEGIAEALGYRPNKLAMRVLAQRATFQLLTAQDQAARESILFGISGFLDRPQGAAAPGDTRRYIAALWETWWRLRSEFSASIQRLPKWTATGVRPGNHPHRRVAALAAIVDRWEDFFGILGSPDTFREEDLCAFFERLSHPYFDFHYTLDSNRAPKRILLIGASRAREILVNQAYPFLLSLPDAGESQRTDIWERYLELPALPGNEKIRRASIRLFGDRSGRSSFGKKAYQQQGLLQIYEDFCLADRSGCASCPFPDQLKQWS